MSTQQFQRWDSIKREQVSCPRADAFIAAIEEVYAKHGLVLSHEDDHGAFIVTDGLKKKRVQWLRHAHVSIKHPQHDPLATPEQEAMAQSSRDAYNESSWRARQTEEYRGRLQHDEALMHEIIQKWFKVDVTVSIIGPKGFTMTGLEAGVEYVENEIRKQTSMLTINTVPAYRDGDRVAYIYTLFGNDSIATVFTEMAHECEARKKRLAEFSAKQSRRKTPPARGLER
jgi:hypothetical protein